MSAHGEGLTIGQQFSVVRQRDSSDAASELPPKYIVSPKRWLVLLIFSSLNLLTDWTCFSLSPLHVLAEETYDNGGGTGWHHLHVAHILSAFLAANVLLTILEPFLLKRFGLRRLVVGAAATTLIGSFIKSGLPFLWRNKHNAFRVTLGFIFVGAAQPFFQVTTMTLVSNWFPPRDRIFATAMALNANQIGIGMAFLVGEAIDSSKDLYVYMECFTYASAALLVAAWVFFASRPENPPSRSAEAQWIAEEQERLHTEEQHYHGGQGQEQKQQQEKLQEGVEEGAAAPAHGLTVRGEEKLSQEVVGQDEAKKGDESSGNGGDGGGSGGGEGGDDAGDTVSESNSAHSAWRGNKDAVCCCTDEWEYLHRTYNMLFVRGFVQTLVVFAIGASITNIVAAFLDDVLDAFDKSNYVWQALVGASFQAAVVLGGDCVAAFNDRVHESRNSASVLLGLTTLFIVMCSICIAENSMQGLWACLILLGVTVGPLKILMADLGVEVIFPDYVANDALFVQQIVCNIFSAVLIWIFDAMKDTTATPYLSAFYITSALSVIATIFFITTYRAKSNRLNFDMKDTLLG